MPSFRLGVLTPLLGLSLGCSALWNPFGYPNPNDCAPDPAICGVGFECNFQLEVCELVAALPTSSRPLWKQQAKLLASDGADHNVMGQSLSIFGDTLLVGSHYASVTGTGTNDGAAYVFGRDPDRGSWTQQAKLTTSDAQIADWAGFSVSLLADTALISAPTSDPGGVAQAGAAYVFERSPGQGTWAQTVKLVANDGMTGDFFGRSLSLFGDTAIISADLADAGGNVNSGAAYVFLRNPGTGAWAQQGPRLVPNDAAAGDQFSRAVSLSSDTALIGALFANPNGNSDAGAAYIFVRDPATGSWAQQAKLMADDGAAGDWFGFSVAVLGDTAIVGAKFANPGSKADAGAAYVFARNPATGIWRQQAKLVADDGAAGDNFGGAVALSGSRAAVTANFASVNGQPRAGAVYVFTRSPGQESWALQARLGAADAAADDGAVSGMAVSGVALSDDTLGLGATGKDNGSKMDVGAAYVFRFARQNGDPCTSGRDCHSTFCADGVCCDGACGGGDPTDCQACSAAAGAIVTPEGDGTCRPRRSGQLCRQSTGVADPPESCDGQSLSCPPDFRG